MKNTLDDNTSRNIINDIGNSNNVESFAAIDDSKETYRTQGMKKKKPNFASTGSIQVKSTKLMETLAEIGD
jgi:hypothetical protein